MLSRISVALCLVAAVSEIAYAAAERAGRGSNLVAGAKYECVFPPNYWGWKNPRHGDRGQLTDGNIVQTWNTAEGEIYSLPSSVGWTAGLSSDPVLLFDLGETRVISAVRFHTVLSQWGPWWPQTITVLVSDDNQNFFLAATQEIELDRLNPPLTPEAVQASLDRVMEQKGVEPSTHWYRTRPLTAQGRYIALVMSFPPSTGTMVLDEVELYDGGSPTPNVKRPTQVFNEGKGGWKSHRLYRATQERLSRDLDTLKEKIARSSVPKQTKAKLLRRVSKLESERDQQPIPPTENFRAVFPISEFQRRLFKIQAAFWQATGAPALRVWHNHRWDPLTPWEDPRGADPAVGIVMVENEVRSDVLNLSNAQDKDRTVTLEFTGLPSEHLDVFDIQMVDTKAFEPVAAAMLPAKKQKDGYLIHVPAGMTRQVWLRCSSKGLKPRTYRGSLKLSSATRESFGARVPMSIEVAPVRLPDRRSIRIAGWDYALDHSYQVTAENMEPYVAMLKEYGANDIPWANADTVMPAGKFDADGNLVSPPPREGLEKWLKMWPGADLYVVVAGALRRDDPPRKMTAWANDWADYWKSKGMPLSKLAILLNDEPISEEELQYILKMGRAIKQASPEIKIWNDIHFADPNKAPPVLDQVMREACDIQTFNVLFFIAEPQAHAAFMEKYRRPGLEWSCYTGNDDRLIDPYLSKVLRPWFCFANGLIDPHWQMHGDGNGGFSWNEYFNNGPSRTPMYIARDSVTTAKYMEALREGAQDYELLLLLKNELSRRNGANEPKVADARRVLDEGVRNVLAVHDPARWEWRIPKDRSTADRVRERILRALQELAVAGP